MPNMSCACYGRVTTCTYHSTLYVYKKINVHCTHITLIAVMVRRGWLSGFLVMMMMMVLVLFVFVLLVILVGNVDSNKYISMACVIIVSE